MHKKTSVGDLLQASESDQLDTGWTTDRVLLNHAHDHRQRGTPAATELTLSGAVCDRIAQLTEPPPAADAETGGGIQETIDPDPETIDPVPETIDPVPETSDEPETPDPPAA